MADSNETQRLNDLLGDIAREDADLEVRHLEMRVMAAAAAARSTPRGADSSKLRYLTIAAAVAAAVAPLLYFVNPAPRVIGAMPERAATSKQVGASAEPPVIARPHLSAPAEPLMTSARRTRETRRPPRTSPAPTTQAPPASSDEFVPLMPMTDDEIAGPFQVVRVQMPRASLGPLRSPFERPNELIQADVLLGEDGMARAIRVSTSESVYPWRSR